MKLLLIRPLATNLSVLSEKATIEILPFDSEKFKGRLQEFVSSLVDYSFDGIIVPDSLDDSLNYLGLELCTRIRLSSNELGNKSYSTFFIYSSKDPQEIYKSQLLQKANTTASLFFTQGTFYFNDNDLVKILIENNSNFNLLNNNNFKEEFLEVIQIKKNPDFGNHTIANIWGAIRLGEVTGNRELLDGYFNSNNRIKTNLSDLYFKFLLNQNSYSYISPVSIKTINSTGKNILLIDDEVNLGWGLILKNILAGANFENISPGINFINEAKAKIKEKINGISKWDLILLDLRLEKHEDQGTNAYKSASEYSGAKILDEIKSDNFGTQVIMYTASNKSWNMRELIGKGADGFYIKESPEFNKEISFSEGNFQSFEKQVQRCYLRRDLKEIWFCCEQIKDKFKKSPLVKYFPSGFTQLRGLQYQTLLLNEIDTIYEIIDSENLNRFNHSLLMQFKILECISEIFVCEKTGADLKFWDGGILKFYQSSTPSLLNRTDVVPVYKADLRRTENERIPKFWYESTGNKIHALLSQKLGFPLNHQIHSQIDSLVSYRNKFIHPKDRINLSPLQINSVKDWMFSILEVIKKI